MKINRREFLMLTAAVAASGCQAVDRVASSTTSAGGERLVDAGPVSNYTADGVYSAFRDQGFFVIRNGQKLFALSAVCTHKKCKLAAEPDHSFYCKCHGSTFDPAGKVTLGPAKRDLPILPASSDKTGRLLVTVCPS